MTQSDRPGEGAAPGEAPTLLPSPAPAEATAASGGLHGRPLSTLAAALEKTRVTEPKPGTTPAGAQTGAYRTVGGGTGTFTRTLRTRINLALPADAQQLDEKLQLSRPSVLVDMTSGRGDVLPKGLRALVETQGTEGRYSIQRPLAAGGMGAVLAIHDNDFRRDAAMKVILGRHADSPEAVERFLAEAQVTAQLEHPNIVPIHDLGVMDDGTVYFTMKLIEGRSLGSVIKALRSGDDAALAAEWTLDRKLMAFLKVLDGIGFAHSRGVVHRDIKPDNIMLGPHGEVLVVDWGIAKVLGGVEVPSPEPGTRRIVSIREHDEAAATMTGAAMGTIFYMPPEQASGLVDEIDARSDIYALGATLYNLLSLKRPLEPGPPAEMVARTISGDLIPLERQAPDLPQDLVAIVRKAMNPAKPLRYASCDDFAADVQRFLAGQAVLARHRNLVERVGAWLAAHKRQAQLGASAAALVALAAGGALALDRRATRARVAELHDEAARELQGAEPALDAEGLERAWSAVVAASGLAPGDGAIAELKQRIFAARDAAQRARAEAERREAAAKRAQELAADADAKLAANDAASAGDEIEAAARLAPDDATVRAARDRIRDLLADQRKRSARKQADDLVARGRSALAQARGLPLDSDALPARLQAAREAFGDATKLPVEPPVGLDALIAETAALAQKAEDARARAAQRVADQRAHDDGLADAQRLADAGDWAKARDAIAAALKRVPDSEPALALRDRIVAGAGAAEAERARAARLAGARADAQAALARARAGMADLAAGDARQVAADAQVAALERSGGDDRTRIKARAAAHENRRAQAERWALTEGEAQAALGLLGEEPTHALAAEARRLLADLYARRLHEARERRAPAEALAFSNLLTRFDTENRYRGDLGEDGRLVVQAVGAATLKLRRVERGADTRFAPVGDERPLTPAADGVALAKGRWQISDGETALTVVVEPGRETLLAWPDRLPRLTDPAIALRYVPARAGGKAFLLGQTEITHDQYIAFVKDPAVLQRALAALNTKNPPALPLLPRTAAGAGVLWQLFTDDQGRYADVKLDDYHHGRPVNGVTRDDAEAFCAWLAQRSGLRVRLPTRDEWRFAADGGDRDRVWPWGEVFDESFAVTAATGRDQTEATGASTTDVGPFGHLGLAGNVREILADRVQDGGAQRVLVAGGSFGDRAPTQFACDATDLIQPDTPWSAVGFRILVELP